MKQCYGSGLWFHFWLSSTCRICLSKLLFLCFVMPEVHFHCENRACIHSWSCIFTIQTSFFITVVFWHQQNKLCSIQFVQVQCYEYSGCIHMSQGVHRLGNADWQISLWYVVTFGEEWDIIAGHWVMVKRHKGLREQDIMLLADVTGGTSMVYCRH